MSARMMSFVRNQQISVVAFLLFAVLILFGMYNNYNAPEEEAFEEIVPLEIPEDDVQQYAGNPNPPPPQGFVQGFDYFQPPPSAANDYVGSPNYMNHVGSYCGL